MANVVLAFGIMLVWWVSCVRIRYSRVERQTDTSWYATCHAESALVSSGLSRVVNRVGHTNISQTDQSSVRLLLPDLESKRPAVKPGHGRNALANEGQKDALR